VSHSRLPDRISNARWFWSLQCAFQYKQKQQQNAAANIFNGASRIQRGAASWSTRAAAAKEAATNGSRKVNVKKKRMGAQKVVVKDAQSSSEGGRSGEEEEEELTHSVKVSSFEEEELLEEGPVEKFENGNDGKTPCQAPPPGPTMGLATKESEVIETDGGSQTQSSRRRRNSKARKMLSNAVAEPSKGQEGSVEKKRVDEGSSVIRGISLEMTTSLSLLDDEKKDNGGSDVGAGKLMTPSEIDMSILRPQSRTKKKKKKVAAATFVDIEGELQLGLSSTLLVSTNQAAATSSHEVLDKDATAVPSSEEGGDMLLNGLDLQIPQGEEAADNANFQGIFTGEGLDWDLSGSNSIIGPLVDSQGALENNLVSQPKRRGRRKMKDSNKTQSDGEEMKHEDDSIRNLKASGRDDTVVRANEVNTSVNYLDVVQDSKSPVQQRITSAKEETAKDVIDSEARHRDLEVHDSGSEQNGVQTVAPILDEGDRGIFTMMKKVKKSRRQGSKKAVALSSDEGVVKKIGDMDEGWIISPVEAGDPESMIDIMLAPDQDWTPQGATAKPDRAHKNSMNKVIRGAAGSMTAVDGHKILLKSGRLKQKSKVKKSNELSLDKKGVGKAGEAAETQIDSHGVKTPYGDIGNHGVKGVAADAQDLTGMETGEDVQTVLQNEDQNGHARTSFKLPSLSWGPWWEEIGSKDTEKESSTPGASVFDDVHIQGEEGTALNANKEISGREIGARERREKVLLLREEPWLLESMDLSELELASPGVPQTLTTSCQEEVEMGTVTVVEPVMEPKKEADMEVEILINSPECTMQRMAILENRKLVEFLVEPVNTKVQVGNVYLGRVKQLLPGMSGIFVDIGGSRIGLLDITRNQYPYTFPPIAGQGCQSLKSDEENSNSMSSFAGDVEGEEFDVENDETLDDSDEEVEDEYIKHSFNIHEEEADSQETQSDNSKVNSRQAVVSGIFGNSQSPDQEVKTSSVGGQGVPEDYEGNGRRKLAVSRLQIGEASSEGPITANFGRKFSKWRRVEEGMTIIVQVKKEAMGKKGPRLTAFPSLAGRFWVLVPRGKTVGVSSKITGPERRRLRLIAQDLQPLDFGITVRTEAMGHQREELEKDLARLMDSWTEVMERAAAAAALVVDEGEEGAVPVLLHREMGQTLTTVRDFFTDKVQRLVVDSPQSYQEVMTYLQDVAPHLTSRVELYSGKVPIFDAFNIEAELEKFSNKRVKLPNGGYLVMEETEALVSIDVNGGVGMLGHSTRQREAILEVNLAAARQIALELRLRDIGGIIVVDFIDMDNVSDENLVYEEMRKAIQRDRSKVFLSEISELGLMEMTRKRVRPSVTLTINEPCSSCKGTGYVEALETILGKIERAVRRLLADGPKQRQVMGSDKWPHILLRTDPTMFEYLRAWKWKRITQLSNALKVWLTLKVAMELTHGQFQVLEQPQFASEKHTPPESKFLHKAVSTNTLGKRVLPKRRRHSSK